MSCMIQRVEYVRCNKEIGIFFLRKILQTFVIYKMNKHICDAKGFSYKENELSKGVWVSH